MITDKSVYSKQTGLPEAQQTCQRRFKGQEGQGANEHMGEEAGSGVSRGWMPQPWDWAGGHKREGLYVMSPEQKEAVIRRVLARQLFKGCQVPCSVRD